MCRAWLLLVCAGFVTGCGAAADDTGAVPVSGTVYLDDKPLADADVVFSSGEFVSRARTGPDGRYTLAAGALPGENKVSITKWEGEQINFDPESGMDAGQFEAEIISADDPSRVRQRPNLPRQIVPPQFNERSTLTYPVPEKGTSTADLRLTAN